MSKYHRGDPAVAGVTATGRTPSAGVTSVARDLPDGHLVVTRKSEGGAKSGTIAPDVRGP
ncbi:hypothetical protein Sgou_29110 [Streptomyces gougerotii]|uniref:Uncharacterized protein n=2 Tax=Streptomyces diastaticus group TaxID=2849069 RepID=A0A8H9HJ33_9ACTN|nr:hypothetical protein Srut_06700 [Streptomyces rutgersensis]GFH69755.1 hypothetical protein Sdia_05230 [Streptomyces diastaticus subsp. diastaticus]GFH78241.1 hypothetical protein Sgou_29110 [Streptomyces gougerotii]GGU19465.1 hypothetical protein GCM10015534_22820 [Streptomyces diastaticus subsp. diastaticus]GGU69680.1 hypothetical protein GCM10010227_24330 [Streptomyces gougerotii]